MAKDAPRGFRPIAMVGGHIPTNLYYIPASYGTALFIGDPVVKTGTSNTADVAASDGYVARAGSLPEINRATAGTGNAVTGIIVGFKPSKDVRETVRNNPASTERIAIVADHPLQKFVAQVDGTAAATDVGANADIVYTHSGDTTTGLSGAEIDISEVATTAAHQVKILRLAQDEIESNALGTNSQYEVLINNHTELPTKAGI